MTLDYKTLHLLLSQPFTISRGTKRTVGNVFVRLRSDGIEGFGEAGPNARYNESTESACEFLQCLPDNFFEKVETEEEIVQKLDALNTDCYSAKAAVEMSWLDWLGKKEQCPLWKQWKAPSAIGPVTSYTIGLDEIEVMQQKVEQAAEYPVYKVKLGTDRDREIIEGLREVTDKPIRVDANEGWTTVEEAMELVRFLADQNIELIEQPMPAGQFEHMIKLKAFSPIPLCADESFTGKESLEEIARAFDIVNIKLMKTGSLIRARRIIKQAKAMDLQIMIGCMIESSLANTAGAILSLWADYADLDGHVLIKDDPFKGLQLDSKKRVMVNDHPGLGVELTGTLFD